MEEQYFVVAVIVAHGLGVCYSMQIFPMRRPSSPFVAAIRDIGVIQILVVRHVNSGCVMQINFRISCHVE